ncbi:hypothetical protein OIU78_003307 [Salix suchowensis]|nr:hypothetical protein OIU78_003307 [Salix suchowensis]
MGGRQQPGIWLDLGRRNPRLLPRRRLERRFRKR